MNEIVKSASNFFKEGEIEVAPMQAVAVLHKVLLSQQNALEACNDMARCVTVMTRDMLAREEVIQKIGHARVALAAATDRLSSVLEALKNPASLSS